MKFYAINKLNKTEIKLHKSVVRNLTFGAEVWNLNANVRINIFINRSGLLGKISKIFKIEEVRKKQSKEIMNFESQILQFVETKYE